jgi:signal transduction histidine kinase
VRFQLDVDEHLPAVLADRTLLQRALTNLVENAVQAMPEAGVLTVSGASDGERVILQLTDTGVGMDEAAVAHAFEPFFSTKTGGSGLGLANARRNIEREGGTVEIASTAGVGTTVTVTLRAARTAPGPLPPDAD